MNDDFRTVMLPHVNKSVLRLGLAGNYGIDSAGVERAAERGVNYWLWSPRMKAVTPVLRKLLAKERDRHVVALLSGLAYTSGMVKKRVEATRARLGIDTLDIYQLPWLGKMSRITPAIEDTLEKLKADGKLLASGTSIHDRVRAGELALNSRLNGFMLRYNAKHPGAERDVFPHLGKRNPFVVAYTATSWRQLTRPLKGVEGGPLSAGDCYRFALSSPHVHVTLTGPANRKQLDENLDALDKGPLSDDEMNQIREYGGKVKAKRRLDYV